MFSDVWSENAAIFNRLIQINSNPPILLLNYHTMALLDNKVHCVCVIKLGFKTTIIKIKLHYFPRKNTLEPVTIS